MGKSEPAANDEARADSDRLPTAPGRFDLGHECSLSQTTENHLDDINWTTRYTGLGRGRCERPQRERTGPDLLEVEATDFRKQTVKLT